MMRTLPAIISQGLSGPAFHALTPDPDTYEMQGVLVGTGGLTTTHTATLYAPDFEGVQRSFAANEPVWSGGRRVRNLVQQSNNFIDSYWVKGGNITVTLSVGTGPSGQDCSRVVLTNGVLGQLYRSSIFNTGNDAVVSLWMKSNTGSNQTVRFGLRNDLLGISVTSEWKRFSFLKSATTIGTAEVVWSSLALDAADILICDYQAEDVSGQTNQNPGEYVPTTTAAAQKVFANQNGNTVLNNVVTEAVGAPLAEVPYLQYYPAAENAQIYSRDLSQGWAQLGATGSFTYDQIGLTGEPNTATLIVDTSGLVGARAAPYTITPNSTNTLKVWIEKQAADVARAALQVEYRAVAGSSTWLGFNLQTGYAWIATAGAGANAFEVIDDGDWWIVLLEVTDVGSNPDTRPYLYPAAYLADDDTSTNANATGQAVYGNVEMHLDKTIAQVRGLGPIFTTTAAVSTDRVVYQFNVANWDDVASAWYLESNTSTVNYSGWNDAVILGPHTLSNNSVFRQSNDFDRLIIRDSANERYISTVFNTQGFKQFGASYTQAESVKGLNYNGSWGVDGELYTGFTAEAKTAVHLLDNDIASRQLEVSWQVRDLRRYTIPDYATGKTIIDDLMAPPALSGTIPDLYVEDTT